MQEITSTNPSPPCPLSQQPYRTACPFEEKYDFLVVADGSGHDDGYGGYCAIVFSTTSPYFTYEKTCGCSMHTSVPRAEFLAILNALHTIVDRCDFEHTGKLEQLRQNKPVILIESDCENIVSGICDPSRKRKAHRDLWAQLAWYEQYFTIYAKHLPRDTKQLHRQVDAIASGMRVVLQASEKRKKEAEQRLLEAFKEYTTSTASAMKTTLQEYKTEQESVNNI